MPFAANDGDLVAAARAVANIDAEIAAKDSAIEDLKNKTAELNAGKKLLIKDRERASLDLRNANTGRRQVFPTEDRRPAEKTKGGKAEAPAAAESVPEPATFTDGGLTVNLSPAGKGKVAIDSYSIKIALADTGAGELPIEGKLARHFQTPELARGHAIQAVLDKLIKRVGDDTAIADAVKTLQDARRKIPGFENEADYVP